MEFEADQSSADIIYYGGTYEILTAHNVPIGPLDFGLTWFFEDARDDLGEYYTYEGNEVTLLHIDRAYCAIMYSRAT